MPTPAELERLLALPNESLSVEYKSWLPLDDNASKATLAKAAIALANHGGGIIVLGMRPDNQEGGALASQPRPQGLARYSQDLINAAINRFADPVFHCELAFSQHPTTNVEHAFVVVPGGIRVPIMCSRDCDRVIAARRCYIRKPGPCSEEPLTGEEWRALLDRCVRAGRDELLDAFRLILQGHAGAAPNDAGRAALADFIAAGRRRWQALVERLPPADPARMPLGYRELGFRLLDVPPAANLTELRGRIDAAETPRLTGWHPFVSLDRAPFQPRPIDGMIETWLGGPEENRALHDAAHSDFWRAHPDGRLMLLRGYSEDAWEGLEAGGAIEISNPIWRIGEAMLFVARFARRYGENPSIVVHCRCTGLEGRTLVKMDGRQRTWGGDRVCADAEVTLETQATATEIEDNLAEVLHPFLVPLYERFAFFELPMEVVRNNVGHLRRGRF